MVYAGLKNLYTLFIMNFNKPCIDSLSLLDSKAEEEDVSPKSAKKGAGILSKKKLSLHE